MSQLRCNVRSMPRDSGNEIWYINRGHILTPPNSDWKCNTLWFSVLLIVHVQWNRLCVRCEHFALLDN